MFHLVSTDQQINEVIQIAKTIWTEHYTPIIGIKQVEYMLNNYHSKTAIQNEINHQNFSYYLVKNQNTTIGYFAIQIKKSTLLLSKIYIYTNQRKQGFGNKCLAFIKGVATKNGINNITLTVNKNNTGSITAYEKLGFEKITEVCTDIGEGYQMDDFKMELNF